MEANRLKDAIRNILSSAGIALNGNQPWDIRIHNEGFYHRILHEGSLGLGESFMDGWWECDCLDAFFQRIMQCRAEDLIKKNWKMLLPVIRAAVINLGCRSRAFQIGTKHYDIGNELYKSMLDKRMVYSCAYWKEAETLDEAQEAKLDLICRKLNLQSGNRVLDIGCGWGSFIKYAAERYGISAVGITVSKEQMQLGRELCAGLPVEIRLQDYRELDETFDHIVSVGMFEHVGYKNYRTYMEVVNKCLRDDGLFLLHTIGKNYSDVTVDPWFDKYIFPNSVIPSMKQICGSMEDLLVLEDLHNFGPYYDWTLMSWFRNFERNWESLKTRYDDRFFRMWKYYLLCSAGSFRSRYLQVWQIVLSRNGVPGGYNPVR